MSDYQKQRYLDLYFEDRARELLPRPDDVQGAVFQGVSIRFGKKEQARKGQTIVHKDPVAGQIKSEGAFSVKVKFQKYKANEKAAGIWKLVTIVYSDLMLDDALATLHELQK